MKHLKSFDECIQNALWSASENINASEALCSKVHSAIDHQNKKETIFMKKPFTLKHAAVLFAALCVTTATVLAAGHITSFIASSSTKPTYTSFPAADTLQTDLGFVPDAIKSFSNGYQFQNAVIGNTSPIDDQGKHLGNYKFIDFNYSNDAHKISLTAEQQMPGEAQNPEASITNYNDLSLSYNSQKYEFVPADYNLTDADKQAEENGGKVFSYGTDSVQENIIQSVIWTSDGITYNLMATDSPLTQEDLISMAEQIIDSDK